MKKKTERTKSELIIAGCRYFVIGFVVDVYELMCKSSNNLS